MMKWIAILIGLILPLPASAALSTSYRVIGYMPSYRGTVSFVRYDKVTHLNYAFLTVNTDGSLTTDFVPSQLTSVVSSAHAAGVNVKVLISVGGSSNSAALGTAINSAASTLKTNLVNFLSTYSLDGIDIDWEFPASSGDATAFTSFIASLATSVHASGKLITIATVGANFVGQYISDTLIGALDWINVDAYDVAGANHSTYQDAVDQLNYFAGRSVAPGKLVLGVPFYGYPSDGSRTTPLAYKDILAADSTAWNEDLASNGYAYNGVATIANKARLSITNAGGIHAWELSMDSAAGNHSLLDAIASVMGNTCFCHIHQ